MRGELRCTDQVMGGGLLTCLIACLLADWSRRAGVLARKQGSGVMRKRVERESGSARERESKEAKERWMEYGVHWRDCGMLLHC